MKQEYNTIEALLLCERESKEMRCPYYGKHCGLIINYDGKGCDKCQKKKICDAITELGDAIMDFKYK